MIEFDYQPYYCEENVWKLCERSLREMGELYVVFISNELGAVPFWHQRAAPSPSKPIFWDYHVIAVSEEEGDETNVWDLDSLCTTPVELERWWHETFVHLDQFVPELHPKFRVVLASDYLEVFSSDRSHMRKPDGSWQRPPPDWPPIYDPETGMNLGRFVDVTADSLGRVLSLEEFRAD